MLYSTFAMADQVEIYNMSLAFNVNGLKEEECQDDDFADDKIHISETAIIVDNGESQDYATPAKIKQYDICITSDNIKTEQSLPKAEYDIINENVKIEDGISTDDIKIELGNALLYCEDCHTYHENYCTECGMLMRILNRTVLINADDISQEELPKNILEIRNYFGEFHVFALKVIPVGVKFGPFTGLNRMERPWKIKTGKFIVDKDKLMYLNWMQYINHAKNISEQNLLVFQYDGDLYYQSTHQIQVGNELLVYFGEEYEASFNRNVEMDFIPTTEHTFKDAFACIFCCLGFSSKAYLAKHKTLCPGNLAREFSIEEIMQCPSCNIHLDQKEYIMHHIAYCCRRHDRKCILPTPANLTTDEIGLKTGQHRMYKCQQCKYMTKYKGDLKHHTNLHYEVKMYKCGVCCRRYKTKDVLGLHVENTHACAGAKEDTEHSTGDYMKVPIKEEHSHSQNKIREFKCSLYKFRTKYKQHLKGHVEVKSLKCFIYKCDMCDYKTNLKWNLKVHIKAKHYKEFNYKCETCDYGTNFKSHLKTHIDTKHLNIFKYKCDTCDYKTNLYTLLRRHIDTKHLKEFKYKCGTCDYKANLVSQLKTHIRTRHLKEFKYNCDSCNYKASFKCDLKRHIDRRHLKQFKYECHTCDYKTYLKADLKRHIERRHLREFQHKCDICDYKANQKLDLKVHIKAKHLREFDYKCDMCDYKAILRSQLKTHVDAKHLKEFKYKCDRCDYGANFKSRLKRHVDTKHLKELSYKCEMCDYKTNLKSHLKVHTETRHLKEFKYKCDRCDYESNWKSNVKTHIETKHLKEFKYNCEACEYKANLKSGLKKHIERTHLKEFKYKCDMCDYKANQKSNLIVHVKAKHLKEFNYKCEICGYETNHTANFRRHMITKHL